MKAAWYRQLLFYGLPGLPLAMLGLPLYVYLPSFYTQEIGLTLSTVGLALLAARSLDVITDPLVGWLNDRLSLDRGRRKLFMLIGVPIVLVGVSFLIKPASSVNGWYLFYWSFVTYTGWTLINIPWQAWGAELTYAYHDKSALAASREMFALLGTLLAITLPVIWYGSSSSIRQNLDLLASTLDILLIICIVPALLWLVERRQDRRFNYLPKIKNIVYAHPALRYLLPAYFLNSLANALPATLFILFVTHVLQAPHAIGWVLMIYFLSGVAGLPLWLWLAKHVDKSRAWTLALILSILAFSWVPLLASGDLVWFVVICIFSGLALGADVALPASIQADIAQQMQHQGSPHTGLLFGLWGLLTKLALALAVGLAFPSLESVGFNQMASTQTPSALAALSWLYAGVPVVLKGWVIWRMWHFPFSESDFRNYWESNYASALYYPNPSTLSQRVQQHED